MADIAAAPSHGPQHLRRCFPLAPRAWLYPALGLVRRFVLLAFHAGGGPFGSVSSETIRSTTTSPSGTIHAAMRGDVGRAACGRRRSGGLRRDPRGLTGRRPGEPQRLHADRRPGLRAGGWIASGCATRQMLGPLQPGGAGRSSSPSNGRSVARAHRRDPAVGEPAEHRAKGRLGRF
jgi:hypothetical protein